MLETVVMATALSYSSVNKNVLINVCWHFQNELLLSSTDFVYALCAQLVVKFTLLCFPPAVITCLDSGGVRGSSVVEAVLSRYDNDNCTLWHKRSII